MSGLFLLTDLPQPAGELPHGGGPGRWRCWASPPVLPVLALFGRLEERPTAPGTARARPAAAVVTAAVVVFIPVTDAALNGLTVGLLGGGAACFVLAVLLLGRVPARSPGTSAAGSGLPLPRPPLSANVEP